MLFVIAWALTFFQFVYGKHIVVDVVEGVIYQIALDGDRGVVGV